MLLDLVYGSYLVFQLFSHKALYDDDHPDRFQSTKYDRSKKNEASSGEPTPAPNNGSAIRLSKFRIFGIHTSSTATPTSSPDGSIHRDVGAVEEGSNAEGQQQDEAEKPKMSVPLTISLLAVVTVV